MSLAFLIHNFTEGSCFTSVYVKWIESAGGQVVPIPFDLPHSQLKSLYYNLNGILFTGGVQFSYSLRYYCFSTEASCSLGIKSYAEFNVCPNCEVFVRLGHFEFQRLYSFMGYSFTMLALYQYLRSITSIPLI
jgi:hypothetical protein